MAVVPMCRALRKQGIEVLLASTNHELTRMRVRGITDYKGIPARVFPVQFGRSFKYSKPLASWLRTSVNESDLVHVHAVFNHASVAAAAACRKAGVPYLVRPLGTLDPWSMKQKPLRKRIFWTISGKTMLQGSAAVHYTTVTEKTATEEYLRLNHGRVIPLGVDVNGSAKHDGIAAHFPALANHSYVLVLSRLHPKKGLEDLIEAFKSLRKSSWRLVIAGDGPPDYVAALKQKASSHPEEIIFTGWVSGELKDALLRNASLLALPSRHENFGLCVLEAMAHGVPVIVSPHVNLASEIEAADAGWVVDLDALARGLAMVLDDESGRRRRGHAAYQFAQQYSWQRTAMELAELYEQILRCSSRSRR